jgi:hypothetical protein
METSWQVSGIEERNAGDGEEGKVWGYYVCPWSIRVWKLRVKVKKDMNQSR